MRDVLLMVQIAICAVLVTSSLVAVRGLVRSVNASFGFDPHNTMLAGVNLASAGYREAQIPQFNRRAIDALAAIPGVEAVGSVNNYPPLVYTAAFREKVFTEQTRAMKSADVALMPYRFNVSPGYLKAAGTVLLAGRDFTWNDDKSKPVPAVANREFAKRMFGSDSDAMGRHFRIGDGTLLEIVGINELNLSKQIISCHPSSLPLPDHVECFVALNPSPSRLKFSEALLGFTRRLMAR